MNEMIEKRFAFGKNWKRYSKGVGSNEIDKAKKSLAFIAEGHDPTRSSFLDIGSGSGLFSRAAYELGFSRIVSFDYDQDSVEATQAMQKAAGADKARWTIARGSVLDEPYMNSLGLFDVVYSWGVLHHTGALWKALDLAARAVAPNGALMIALYNDQGWISRYWALVKKAYVSAPLLGKGTMLLFFWAYFGIGLFLADIVRLRNPFARHSAGDVRGMRFFTDVIDWIGGFPFEVASPAQVASFLKERGFQLKQQTLAGRRHGCNEFLFVKKQD